jgi:NhaP-type Na+/H+ or K+/H+ antiporter
MMAAIAFEVCFLALAISTESFRDVEIFLIVVFILGAIGLFFYYLNYCIHMWESADAWSWKKKEDAGFCADLTRSFSYWPYYIWTIEISIIILFSVAFTTYNVYDVIIVSIVLAVVALFMLAVHYISYCYCPSQKKESVYDEERHRLAP